MQQVGGVAPGVVLPPAPCAASELDPLCRAQAASEQGSTCPHRKDRATCTKVRPCNITH